MITVPDRVHVRATEASEQAAVIDWRNVYAAQRPELALLFHCPNGEYRHMATAKRLQAMGVSSGVPDLLLPIRSPRAFVPSSSLELRQARVHRRDWIGLAIEMKVRRNTPSPSQTSWLLSLARHGWRVVVAYSARGAIAAIIDYLELPISWNV